MNKVRKRRSGHSSLKESLPMRRHLTHSHDKAMTEHFADGTAHPAQPRAAAPPVVEPFIGPSFAAKLGPMNGSTTGGTVHWPKFRGESFASAPERQIAARCDNQAPPAPRT